MNTPPDWATHVASGINGRGTPMAVWIAKGKFKYFQGSDYENMNHFWDVEDWKKGVRDSGWIDARVEAINICLENK